MVIVSVSKSGSLWLSPHFFAYFALPNFLFFLYFNDTLAHIQREIVDTDKYANNFSLTCHVLLPHSLCTFILPLSTCLRFVRNKSRRNCICDRQCESPFKFLMRCWCCCCCRRRIFFCCFTYWLISKTETFFVSVSVCEWECMSLSFILAVVHSRLYRRFLSSSSKKFIEISM